MSIVARQEFRTPRNAALFLIAFFVVCLLCQAFPETAAAHHSGSSESDHTCATVAEVSPVSPVGLLVGSFATAGSSCFPAEVFPSGPASWGGGDLSGPMCPQPDAMSPPIFPAIYCLNCTYRL